VAAAMAAVVPPTEHHQQPQQRQQVTRCRWRVRTCVGCASMHPMHCWSRVAVTSCALTATGSWSKQQQQRQQQPAAGGTSRGRLMEGLQGVLPAPSAGHLWQGLGTLRGCRRRSGRAGFRGPS
jgi:hypothetical protein